jgi:tmRNA-binding protein
MPTLKTSEIGINFSGESLFVQGTPAYDPNYGCPDVNAAAQFCIGYFQSYFHNIKFFGVLCILFILMVIVFERKQARNRRVLAENKEILRKLEEKGQKGVKIVPLLKEVIQKMDDHDTKPKEHDPRMDKKGE